MKRVVILICLLPFILASVDDSSPSLRIVGGKESKPEQFPFIASVRVDTFENLVCAASIINNKTVLTAAHCVYDINPEDLKVPLGTTLLDHPQYTYGVEDIIYHDQFDPITMENDIAILKLDLEIFDYNDIVAPIDLEEEVLEDGMEVTYCGWGSNEEGGELQYNLQYLRSNTLSFEECVDAYRGDRDTFVFDTEICVNAEVLKGSCNGDGGGPLISNSGKLVGILSWGKPCALGYPDVFTRVSSYIDWIKKHL